MKVRIKFSKLGEMKFIGHLDLMRYFQKAIRRSGLDIHFSEGMSPHMVMSFAAPLGVGLTSEGEYMDLELNTPVSTKEGIARLNACMVDGVRILAFRQIEEGKAGKGMSLVSAADYLISLRDSSLLPEDWAASAVSFFENASEILIEKETKKGISQVDLKPLIYAAQARENGLFLQLSCGSVANIKPEAALGAYVSHEGLSLPPHALCIHRLDVYADNLLRAQDPAAPRFVPLIALGSTIE